jgi:hypothetical protein
MTTKSTFYEYISVILFDKYEGESTECSIVITFIKLITTYWSRGIVAGSVLIIYIYMKQLLMARNKS